MDKMIPQWLRKKAVEKAAGNVLEVGVGTGANLEYYLPGCRVTGIDFSPAMLQRARKKSGNAKVPITLLEMDAQEMSFPDNIFDTVIATCVFCSVPDPIKGLKEVKRVCKPNGKIILLEHVRSDNFLLGKLMDIVNPFVLYVIGSNINRETIKNIQEAGIKQHSIEQYSNNIVKLIVAAP
jgi:ubiquinone/menaquinone biosynthesis C-methylase UbiE